MKQIQDLFQVLGIQPDLKKEPQPEELVRYAYRNSYCLNEEGKLTGLNLCGLKLSFTHEQAAAFAAFDWSELISLNLSENRFAVLSLPAMPKLRFLNLSEIKELDKLTFENALPALEELDLNECDISQPLLLPEGFHALRYLDLSRNQHLKELNLQGEFPVLSYLDASGNALKKLQFSASLPALENLYVGENLLDNWDWLQPFPQLQTLHINNNRLKALPTADVLSFEKFFPEILNLNIANNNLPDTVKGFSEGKRCDLEKLDNYLLDYAKGSELDNECKVLLIGNGNVGKSCLVNRIVNDKFNPKWDSTHAIVVMEPYEDERVEHYKLNFWDFGGQDIYHATHRLFMQSNAVYLLLWDTKTEGKPYTIRPEAGKKRKYRNYRLPYWLAYATQLGKGSPILIVQTKCIDPEDVRDRPPHIRKAYPKTKWLHIDSEKEDWDDNGVNELLTQVRRAVKNIKPKTEIPSNWVDVRQAIQDIQEKESHLPEAERKQQTLSKEAFLQIAASFKVTDPMMVLQWLSLTGVVFYDFERERLFEGKIILDQGWAIRAIYTLLDREGLFYKAFKGENATFSGNDLLKYAWQGKSQADCELFVSFMLSCELCFEVTKKEEDRWRTPFGERLFIAPQMLPDTKHPLVEKHWRNVPSLYIHYRHPFLHYGIMQSFIIRTQKLAKVDEIWKNGIYLSHTQGGTEHQAQIEFVDKTERTDEGENTCMELHVRVSKGGKFLLDAIRNLIEELQDSPGTESVSVDGKNFVLLHELQSHDRQEPRIKCENGWYHDFASFHPFLQKDSNATIDSSDTDSPNLPMSKTQSVKAQKYLRALLAEAELHQVLTLLRDTNPQKESHAIHQLSRLNEIKKQEAKGTIDPKDATRTRNQIRNAIAQMLDELSPDMEIEIEAPLLKTVSVAPKESSEPKPKVYFSYAWGDDDNDSREEIVNHMYDSLTADGLEVKRDKISMDYGDLISEFMKELGEGDLVIVFVSKKYMESEFCMWELCEIYRTSMLDKKKFANRILPIRVESLNLKGPRIAPFLDYWNDKYEEFKLFNQKYSQQTGLVQKEEEEKIKTIKDTFATVIAHFNDMSAKTNSLLSENDFERVKSMILKRLGK